MRLWFLFLAAVTLPAAASDSREIAEWVIRSGGRVLVSADRAPVADLARLPQGDLTITGLDFTGTIIEPKELERISGLTTLRELYLPGPSWNPGAGSKLDANEELKFLGGLTGLEKLSFSIHFLTNVNVRDKGIAHLAGLTKLKEFRCSQCRIEKDSLAPFVELQALDLSYSTAGDEVMATIAGMKNLRRLILRDTLVTEDGLRHLSGLAQLEELDLYGLKIGDRGVAHLRGLRSMRKLNLLGSPVTDASAAVLASMPLLEDLNLYRSEITNTGLAKLAALRTLSALDVRYSRVTGQGVAALKSALPGCTVEFAGAVAARQARTAAAPAGTSARAIAAWVATLGGKAEIAAGGATVRAISLASTGVSDAQLRAIGALADLEELDLEATEASDLGLEALRNLRSLKVLRLGNTTVSDAGLAHLSGLTNLRTLRLEGTLVRGAGLAHLKAAPLVELDLTSAPVGDAGAAVIGEIATLERLSLGYTEITDQAMASVAKLRGLAMLDLSGADVGDKGVVHLAALTNLRDLRLNHGRFTDPGLEPLRALTNLERFEAVRTRLSDKGIGVIASFQQLRALHLDYTPLTDAGLAHLRDLPLTDLRLDSAAITDAAIPSLGAMSGLRSLNLYHTLVTEKGHGELKKALPQCAIVWERDSALPNRRGS